MSAERQIVDTKTRILNPAVILSRIFCLERLRLNVLSCEERDLVSLSAAFHYKISSHAGNLARLLYLQLRVGNTVLFSFSSLEILSSAGT
jgi:hypothetical protein